jgi:hypothetical protein
LKSFSRYLPVFLLLFFLPVSCGYHNPYIYNGPETSVYISPWNNKTNELRLNSLVHQSLVNWYQKSDHIRVTKSQEGADLILAGEILSISLPSLSYGVNNVTTEVKVGLRVRYILKNIKTGKVLMEVPSQSFSESYLVNTSSAISRDYEYDALGRIIDDLSEKIYLNTLNQLQHL